MKYYVVLATYTIGKGMTNFSRVVGPHYHKQAKKLETAFLKEQKVYMTHCPDKSLETVTKWAMISEKKYSEMRGN
jgi:hypothetical protein